MTLNRATGETLDPTVVSRECSGVPSGLAWIWNTLKRQRQSNASGGAECSARETMSRFGQRERYSKMNKRTNAAVYILYCRERCYHIAVCFAVKFWHRAAKRDASNDRLIDESVDANDVAVRSSSMAFRFRSDRGTLTCVS